MELVTSDGKPDLPEDMDMAEAAEIIARNNQLLADLDSLETAISLAANPADAENPHSVPQTIHDKAKKFKQLAERRPDVARQQLTELRYEIEDHLPFYYRAIEARLHHRRREADTIARELQPRQRAAVKKIAKALEALSIALIEEADVRHEFRQRSPHPDSAYLPDCTREIAMIGAVGEYGAPAQRWACRMRELGVLK